MRSLRCVYSVPMLGLALLLLAGAAGAAPQSVPVPAAFMGPVSNYLYPHLHNLVWDTVVRGRVFAASPIGGWRSDDGGTTWAALSESTPNLHYGRLLHDRGTGRMYLYRVNDWRLYRSTDSGVNWQISSEDMFKQVALAPGSADSLFAVNGDLKICRSDDGGASWRELAQPREATYELLMAVSPVGSLGAGGLVGAATTLYALADRELFVSRDSGASWQPQGTWPADAPPRELAVADDGALIALVASNDTPSVSASALLRSTDGGASWLRAPLPTPRIAVITVAGAQVWAGSDDGRVWRTVNLARWGEGAGWRETPLALAQPVVLRDDIPYTPSITDIAPGPDGTILIGTIHGVYRATTPDGPALLRARGLLPTAALPTNSVSRPTDRAVGYFPETGHTLQGLFLQAWKRAGGLQMLGLPRSEPFIERNVETGRDLLVQYFERGRLEADPAGGQAQLGRLGPELMAAAGLSFQPTTAQRGCQFFPQTGHSLCGGFLSLWRARGGAATVGYPLSEGVARDNGREQWFERGRLADQGKGTFLCLIGSEELWARGWIP